MISVANVRGTRCNRCKGAGISRSAAAGSIGVVTGGGPPARRGRAGKDDATASRCPITGAALDVPNAIVLAKARVRLQERMNSPLQNHKVRLRGLGGPGVCGVPGACASAPSTFSPGSVGRLSQRSAPAATVRAGDESILPANRIRESSGCGRAVAWDAAKSQAAESTKVDFVQL